MLVKSKPGNGKTSIVWQVCEAIKAQVVLMHPAISDPTDFKGLPALSEDRTYAHFLPFGDLQKLCTADRPTVAFLDDIGQAAPAVQAALMQLILARSVNGTGISPEVVFIGATNDTTHMAGVSGMIEPLKSRWDTIVELETSVDDWSTWALNNNMPAWLVGFMRFRPALLSKFEPTKQITNSPSPRGWTSVGNWSNAGIHDLEVWVGAVGEGAATEAFAFYNTQAKLPSLDAILLDPDKVEVPEEPACLYAVSAGLARKATPSNLDRVTTYLARMPKEFDVSCMKDARRLTPAIQTTPAFVTWSVRNKEVLM